MIARLISQLQQSSRHVGALLLLTVLTQVSVAMDVSVSDLVLVEGQTLDAKVTLSEPAGADGQVVLWELAGASTGASTADVAISSGRITIAANQTEGSISINAISADGNEDLFETLSLGVRIDHVINSGFENGSNGFSPLGNGNTFELNPETTYGGSDSSNMTLEVDRESQGYQDLIIKAGVEYIISLKATRRTKSGPEDGSGNALNIDTTVSLLDKGNANQVIEEFTFYRNNEIWNLENGKESFSIPASNLATDVRLQFTTTNSKTLGMIIDDLSMTAVPVLDPGKSSGLTYVPDAAAQVTIIDDSAAGAPTPVILNAPAYTNVPFEIDIQFTQDVTGFGIVGLYPTNSELSNFIKVDDANYKVTVTPNLQGEVTVTVAAGTANAVSDNTANAQSQTVRTQFDNQGPLIAFTDWPASFIGTFTTFIEFDSDVATLIASEIVPTNATLGSFTKDNNKRYSFTVTPTNNALPVSISIAENSVVDVLGQGNALISYSALSQTQASALKVITDYAKNNGAGTAPVLNTFTDLLIAGVTATNIEQAKKAIASLNEQDVDTQIEIQEIVDAINKINTFAGSGSGPAQPEPSVKDYDDGGYTGVTDNNRDRINEAVKNATPPVNVQDVIDAELAGIAESALQKIQNYAKENGDTSKAPAPILNDFSDLSVTGVSAGNIAQVNKIIAYLNEEDVNSQAKVQAIVDAVNNGAADTDEDEIPDAFDKDADGDGICDATGARDALCAAGPTPVQPLLWLDASNPGADDSVSYADNDAVTNWKNKAADEFHASVLADGNKVAAVFRPAAINGKPALDFTHTGETSGSVYEVNGLDVRPSAYPDLTFFTVYKPKAYSGPFAGQGSALWGVDNGDWDRFYYERFPSNGDSESGIVGIGPTAQNVSVPLAGEVDKVKLLTVLYRGDVQGGINQGAADASFVAFGGRVVQRFTDSTNASDQNPQFHIGWDGDNSPAHAYIAEVLVYDKALTECQIEGINDYLSAKYGEAFLSDARAELIEDIAGNANNSYLTLALLKKMCGVNGVVDSNMTRYNQNFVPGAFANPASPDIEEINAVILAVNNNGADNDKDGILDVFDPDDDNDGVEDTTDTASTDPCIPDPANGECDFDKDGTKNKDDADDDNDGVCDTNQSVANVCVAGPDLEPTNPDNDSDGDGTSNKAEKDAVPPTNPGNPDTDGDGICDGGNSVNGQCSAGPDSNPTDPDQDKDGICDGNKAVDGICSAGPDGNPTDPDQDKDGICDGNLAVAGVCVAGPDGNPTDPDQDNDGICDGNLAVAGVCAGGPDSEPTNPDNDTDGDGTSNKDEMAASPATDPSKPDTDGDGVCDGAISVGTICNAGPDAEPTNPNNDDDGDGIPNIVEKQQLPSSNPTDACDPDNGNGECDLDKDGVKNAVDDDDDGDGVNDANDPAPTDACIPSVTAALCDLDKDGKTYEEETTGSPATAPFNPDSDNDGVCDGDLAVAGTCSAGPDSAPNDPNNDSDGDGISNIVEMQNDPASDPADACDPDNRHDECDFDKDGTKNKDDDDDDNDGVKDVDEATGEESDACLPDANAAACDQDKDGKTNTEELHGVPASDPTDPDSDGDGICDGYLAIAQS